MKTLVSLSLAFVFAAAVAHADANHDHSSNAAVTPAEIAFDKIKSLAGTWEGTNEGQKMTVTYEVVSGGKAVIAKVFDMVDVYHLAGDKLMLTHYCSAGNQPRMIAIPPQGVIEQIAFRFLDITNLKKEQGGHISGLTLIMNDSNSLIQRWSNRDLTTGKDTSFDFVLKRTK